MVNFSQLINHILSLFNFGWITNIVNFFVCYYSTIIYRL